MPLLPLNHSKPSNWTIFDDLSSVHFSEKYQISSFFVKIGDFWVKSLIYNIARTPLFFACFLKLINFLKTLLSKGKNVRLNLFWMEIVTIFLIKNTYSYWKFMFCDF